MNINKIRTYVKRGQDFEIFWKRNTLIDLVKCQVITIKIKTSIKRNL